MRTGMRETPNSSAVGTSIKRSPAASSPEAIILRNATSTI
jgi:hypothetical protein